MHLGKRRNLTLVVCALFALWACDDAEESGVDAAPDAQIGMGGEGGVGGEGGASGEGGAGGAGGAGGVGGEGGEGGEGGAPGCDDGVERPCDVIEGCTGTAACVDGAWNECAAPAEVCDDLDNDCDGLVDEDVCPVCGDGAINVDGEQCDDGNLAIGDGCDAACQTEPDAGAVRLVALVAPGHGRVEMYQNGAWGSICDTFWGDQGADVVCLELGYLGGQAVQDFGGGDGPFARVELACDGTEARLNDCNFNPEGMCTHDNDIGVICNTGEEGNACVNDGECQAEFACVLGVCSAGFEGDACVRSEDCQPDFACEDGACQTGDCGDGWVNPATETCEDGNAVAGDGCSDCQLDAEPSPIAARGGQITLGGTIDDADALWARPEADCAPTDDADHAYQAFVIVNNTGADQELDLEARWRGDGYLHVFDAPFDAARVDGCVTGNDDRREPAFDYRVSEIFVLPIAAGQQRVVVASTFEPGQLIGGFAIDIRTRQAECGDGLINVDGELCDDGNLDPGDGCNADCQIEDCGNGALNGDEQCDDGNFVLGDGCDADCQVEPEDGALRLELSVRRGRGRLGVFHAGEWGTVCGDSWDIDDAQVACRQLGFPRAIGLRAARRGNGPIWLDEVECTGDEERLLDCPANEIGETDCDHAQDAGVICVLAAEGEHCLVDETCAVGTGCFGGQCTPMFNDHGYRLTSSPLNFNGARAEAVAAGGHLAAIKTAAEQAWLFEFLGEQPNAWIGLTDRAQEGVFVWDSGEPLDYAPSCGNGPDNSGGGENVVALVIGEQCWNDVGGSLGGARPTYGIIEIPRD